MPKRFRITKKKVFAKPRRRKYNNKKVNFDGYTFDSIKEWKHYLMFREEKTQGKVTEIKVHPRYPFPRKGQPGPKIGHYTADFRITYADGRQVVYDVKSPPTRKEVL